MDEDKKVGRKQRPAPDNFIEIYAGLMEGDINKTQATRLLECSSAQLNIWLLQHHLEIMHNRIDELEAKNTKLVQERDALQKEVLRLNIMNNKEGVE